MSEELKEAGIFLLQTALVFGIIVGIPFLISGIWPPFVSVISDSMEPNMERGDMIFIVENDRFVDEGSINGISISNDGDERGDVIVFTPDGDRTETPVIHRAIDYAEEGDDWTENIDNEHLSSDSCDLVSNCPAPHNGFITLGDANDRVDQDAGISSPVKDDWIIGKSEQRLPYLGWVRITFTSLL